MQERRRRHRTQVFKIAKLIVGEQHLACDCIVRDITANGARLALTSTETVPNSCDLTFDAAHTLRPCRVIWRTTWEIGVEFQDKSFHAAA